MSQVLKPSSWAFSGVSQPQDSAKPHLEYALETQTPGFHNMHTRLLELFVASLQSFKEFT